jgi:S-adenosylmethionine hydrolase
MSVITLTTDFGIRDGNVGVMKGVIWGIAPQAQIADLSHMIAAQNILEASVLLARSASYFPQGTIHVVVVDPGVGTARRPMAGRIGNWFYVGPDNGTISGWLERAGRESWDTQFVQLDKLRFWLPNVSFVFHGRDIFAPVAAHLANGVALAELGTPFDDPVRLELPQPVRTGAGWLGEVIHIDHFGNVATNIRIETLGEYFQHKESLAVRLGGLQIEGLVNTFGEGPVGRPIALMGSTGNLIVALVNGNAARELGIGVGDRIEVITP